MADAPKVLREPYLAFLRRTLPPTWSVEAEHIRLIAEHLDKVRSGEIDRLAIHMPPRHGKSESVTYRFPICWHMDNPGCNVLVTGYNQRFANKFGRRTRNLAKDLGMVSGDKAASDEWETTEGGLLMARGVGSPPTGTGFNLIVIDDPVRRRQDAESETVRESTWDWYTDDLYQRLEPGGAIVLIMCMTGDTPVLMADGSEKMLRDVRPGDHIATYDNGAVGTSTIRNWANQGPDNVYEIRMKSGIIVKANARHPFLVEAEGGKEWRRTAMLKKGDKILRVTGANGEALPALKKAVTSQQNAKGCVTPTTISGDGQMALGHLLLIPNHVAKHALSTDTELMLTSTTEYLRRKKEFAQSVNALRVSVLQSIGATGCASIIAMNQEPCEDCSVTSAISPSDSVKALPSYSPPLSTYEVTADEIFDVVPVGVEDVYDIQVDRTENFIANGLVSHNTLWHEDDIGARAVASEPGRWTVLKLPAFAEEDDPMGRQPGAALWPDRFPVDALQRIRDVMARKEGERAFEALYQQNPTPREGSMFKVSKLEIVQALPAGLKSYRKWDIASTSGDGDWTAGVKVDGPDKDGIYYVSDVVRGQWGSDERNRQMLQTAQLDGRGVRIVVPQDPGAAGVDMAKSLVRLLSGFSVKAERETGSKETRADPFAAQVNAGNVRLVAGDWNRAFIEELRSFPQGKNDDQVDAAAGAFNEIAGPRQRLSVL